MAYDNWTTFCSSAVTLPSACIFIFSVFFGKHVNSFPCELVGDFECIHWNDGKIS